MHLGSSKRGAVARVLTMPAAVAQSNAITLKGSTEIVTEFFGMYHYLVSAHINLKFCAPFSAGYSINRCVPEHAPPVRIAHRMHIPLAAFFHICIARPLAKISSCCRFVQHSVPAGDLPSRMLQTSQEIWSIDDDRHG